MKAEQRRISIKVKRGLDERSQILVEDIESQIKEETYDLIEELRRKGVIRDDQ